MNKEQRNINKETTTNLVLKFEVMNDSQHEIFEQCKAELDEYELDTFCDFVNTLCRQINEIATLIGQQDPTILERMQFGCVLGVQSACSIDKLVHTAYNIDELKEGINV